ncbi:MAG: histidine kinase [Candidatus Omnitrophota bacterium]
MKSIRSKLILWICILFIGIGALIYFPLSVILPAKISSQIIKRDIEIAEHLSGEIKTPLLLDDKIALSLYLRDSLENMIDAQYLFIQRADGSIVSHTFEDGFPKGLLTFGSAAGKSYQVKSFISEGRTIHDIAIPIMNGEIGTLHVGVSMESGREDIADIARINRYVALVILVGLGVGIAVFLVIGFLFSDQIITLKNFAQKIGQGNLKEKINITSDDEIGALAAVFNEMTTQLEEKIGQIKRLNSVEERSRIAFDLHDGCAQDMATIIKRIELCEILFMDDPKKAFKELETLRESAKDILDRTRRIIFELKSPDVAEFDLKSQITGYLNEYKRNSGLNVAIDLPGSLEHLLPEKSKTIFYIMLEALANTRKHSRAKNVSLRVQANGDSMIALDIKDDGCGFDVTSALSNISGCGKLGLISMRQRACSLGGTFDVVSSSQEGTEISVRVPM